MKFFTNNILLFTFIILISMSGYAEQANNPPTPTTQSLTEEDPGTEPGTPIDENIILLVLTGVSFGIYIIHKQNKKRPT